MLIGKLAELTGVYIQRNSDDKKIDIEKTIYVFYVLYDIAFVFFSGLIISLIFNTASVYIISFFAFMILRYFSKTAWHFENDFMCYMFSTLVLTSLPLIEITYSWVATLLQVISLSLILFLAPYKINNEINRFSTITSKTICLLIVLSNFLLIHSDILTVAFFAQALSLIPFKKRS